MICTLIIQCSWQFDIMKFFQSTTIGPAFSNYLRIIMKNCQQLTIQPGSFTNSSGGPYIIIQNIKELRLMERSFEMDVFGDPRLSLTIDNCSISQFPQYTFSTTEIDNNTTDFVNPSRSIPQLQIQISNSMIQTIAARAFGSFTLLGLSIINSTIDLFASEALNNSVNGNVMIINTTITQLQTQALTLQPGSETEDIWLQNNTFIGKIVWMYHIS